ncbi:MAG: CPCC family cysteine-rich protein [Acidobacteriota bacterium]
MAKVFIRSPCEVCDYLTHAVDERGLYFICPVCYWEDDEFHEDSGNPCDVNHGLSLDEARANYKKFGACEEDMVVHVRAPKPEELPQM